MVPCFISFVNSHFTIIHMSLSANSLSASVYCFIYPTLNKFYLSIYLSIYVTSRHHMTHIISDIYYRHILSLFSTNFAGKQRAALGGKFGGLTTRKVLHETYEKITR